MTVRKIAIQLTVLTGLCLCLTGASARPPIRDFWALNDTGKEIRYFYVSPHDVTEWGDDVLGRATLADGMGTKIVFPRREGAPCNYDFKLVFADGTNQVYQNGRDICAISAIVYNAAGVTALKIEL
jgi:hypothetical protein